MLAATACGRVNFDPSGTATDAPVGGGSDGSTTTGDGPPADPDAAVTACTGAIQVTVDNPITIDTCATGKDLLDGCSGAALDEVVFVFVAPIAGSYTVRTFDSGTANVITTASVDAPCTGNAGCFGIKSAPMSQGQTSYFAVEAAAGACQMIDFSVTMP